MMENNKIIDLFTTDEKATYELLKKELMTCVSDNERDVVNSKISNLVQKVLIRQLQK